MANNCPCNPPATGVPAGPAVPWHRLLPASPPCWTPAPRPPGAQRDGGGLSQQKQLWGSESEICEGNSRSCQSGWRRQVAARADGGARAQAHSLVLTRTSTDQNQRQTALAKFFLPNARHLLTGPWHSSLPGHCWLCWGTALGYLSRKHPHTPKAESWC